MDYRAESIADLITNTLSEDLNKAGDLTTNALFSKEVTAAAEIRSKSSGVLSGTPLLGPIFTAFPDPVAVTLCCRDGDRLVPGQVIARLDGSVRSILGGERTALNFLQRLSGIATVTAGLCGLIAHTSAKLLDTRKTTPLLRGLEKKAVVDGGGVNHRFGLFDMILIKDTHVQACGGPGNAVSRVRQAQNQTAETVPIEVEVQSIEEFRDAAGHHPDRIMLDNMSIADMKACVELRDRQFPGIELEASGNVDEGTIVAIAETGVDFISAGMLTHSVTALDIHLVVT